MSSMPTAPMGSDENKAAPALNGQLRLIIQNTERCPRWQPHKIALEDTTLLPRDLEAIQTLLSEGSQSITILQLKKCRINERSLIALLSRLGSYRALTTVSLSECNVHERAISALGTALQQGRVKNVDLGNVALGVNGARVMAAALRDSGIERMYLGHTRIGDEGMEQLAKAFETGTVSLQILDVSGAQIGSAGFSALARTLPMTRLRGINLGMNAISAATVQEVCSAIEMTPSMESLFISGAQLNDESARTIASILPKTGLLRLKLNANDITDVGLIALADAIHLSKTLQVLEMKRNPAITDSAARYFWQKVKTHMTLKRVEFDESGVSPDLSATISAKVAALQSERRRAVVLLCAAKIISRLGAGCTFDLPVEHLRLLAAFLG